MGDQRCYPKAWERDVLNEKVSKLVQMVKILNPRLVRLMIKLIIEMKKREYYLKVVE